MTISRHQNCLVANELRAPIYNACGIVSVMNGRSFLAAVVCMILPTMASRADDETVRCGNSIVTSESAVSELQEKCGQPTTQQVTEEEVRTPVGAGDSRIIRTTVTEIWTYDRGSRAFKIVVTIVDGKIRNIVSQP